MLNISFSVMSLATIFIPLLSNAFTVFLHTIFLLVHQIQILYLLYNACGML